MRRPVRILVLSGNVIDRHTHALARSFADACERYGAVTDRWQPIVEPLPFADPAYHHAPMEHPDPAVRAFVARAVEADGFALASPVYHNSYSGVLKNALDHLSIPQFAGKPVALLGHGGHRTSQAVDHLRIVVRGLHAIAIPTQVCTDDVDYAVDETGYAIVSDDIGVRLRNCATELVTLAQILSLTCAR